MGCKNSTAKSADDKKGAPQNLKTAPAPKAQRPAEKPKRNEPADDATHLTVATTPAATPAAAPAVEQEDEVVTSAAQPTVAAEAQAEEAPAAVEEAPLAPPAEAAAVAAADAAASADAAAAANADAAGAAVAADVAAEEAAASAAAPQGATAPEEEEDDASPDERPRHAAVAPIHQASQTQRAADSNSPYVGPGPAEAFPIDNIYRCFEEDNGLLFRLVSKKRHMWAFYNDTTDYVMRVAVTFGPESSVTPLDDTQATVVSTETGECTLVLDVPPGETKRFMRGEYNGFTTSYDANPVDQVEEKLEAALDVAVVQPLQFSAAKAEGTCEGGNVPLEDASDDGTRIHFMEVDPNKEEVVDDMKKRREEA